MRKLLLAAVVAVSLSGRVGTENIERTFRWAVQSGMTREPVVGLLPLPDVVGEGCGSEPPAIVPVYDAPSASSSRLGSVSLRVTGKRDDSCDEAVLGIRSGAGGQFDELPTEESGYEILAAIVYQRSGNWFRIALQGGSGWIHRASAAAFQAYPELLTHDHLCHLQSGWDGLLWATPGEGTPKPVSSAWKARIEEQVPVDVLELRQVANRRWIRVRIANSPCTDDEKAPKPVTGWLPVYGRSGVPTVWFYSRGC